MTLNPITLLAQFFIRVRCSYHGHYWVTGSINVDEANITHVVQYCARFCGTIRHRSYSAPEPTSP